MASTYLCRARPGALFWALWALLRCTHPPADAAAQAAPPPTPAAQPEPTFGAAGATHDAPEPAGYRQLIEDAVHEYELGNHEEARSLFARAHALLPSARTLRGLGKTEFELRNYAASVAQLEAALGSSIRPLEGETRVDTERLLARARGFVGRLQLDAKPTASAVLIDGIPVTAAPGRPLVLNVGDHVVEVSAPGYAPEKRRVSIEGGEQHVLMVLFTRAVTLADAPPTETNRWYRSPWLWSAVGVAVAGATVGAVLATRGGSEKLADAYGGTTGTVLMGPVKEAR